jgi:tetratricopeptide (TPR) repeat protein
MERALSDIDRAIELNPNDAKHFNNRGFMRMGMEQFQAALVDFDKAIELAPRYKNAFNNRGLLFIAQKRFEDAIVQFNRAIEIDDQYLDAYNNRGFAETESGQAAKALDDFNVVIELNPKYVNAYNNRGLLLAQAGDYENALLDFTRAMMLDPMNPKYYEHRQEVYRKQGEYRKAMDDEKKYDWLVEYHLLTAEIAAATNPVDELIQRAEHFLEINDLDKAVDDLNRALSLDAKSSQALVIRAGIFLKQKSPATAQADAEAALAIAPSEQAYSILGDVFLGRGDYDRAIEYFARAHRIDESVADAYYGKSKLLESQGQSEQAKTNLEQALALDPDVERRLR